MNLDELELYLLDANVLIDASRDYYPIDRIPEFWEWLIYVGTRGNAKIPVEVYEEIREGKDELSQWVKMNEAKKALLFEEEVEVSLVTRVIEEGYAPDLNEDEIEQIGRDPFLIAHALASPNRCVVTTEVSKPSKKRANRHIPDICDDLQICP